METMYIEVPKLILDELCYQITLKKEGEKSHLNTVNIMLGKKRLIKIREEDTPLDFLIENAENIALDFLSRRIQSYQPKKKKSIKKATKQEAAENLMKHFNL